MTTVLLADDHRLVRAGLVRLLATATTSTSSAKRRMGSRRSSRRKPFPLK